MCGITGKISLTHASIDEHTIRLMNRAVAHRGPDDRGTYLSPDHKVGLGHQRLAILDLSARGHQPMHYLNKYTIVFNGEIYNFKQQRKILEKQGYQFNSDTDTEVILALYDRDKEDCLSHMRGMFALAIYDRQDQILFCARDRVGKKPLKYFYNGSVFIFASELKSILTQPEYKREPDPLAIHHYLTYQYCPAPFTGFKDIKKLPPAHFLKLNIRNRKLEIKRYWQLNFSNNLRLSEDEWGKRIINKLDESVRLRMISDVPLGAFLSGGVDSSAIVALMSKASSRPVKTFSIGFEEEKFNELPHARRVARLFNTDHTEFTVKPQALDILPELVRHYEEPYADSSAIPTYYLSQLTRQHVTVALNGDGGDENFAGYSRYNFQKIASFCDRMPSFTWPMLASVAGASEAVIPTTLTHRAHRFLRTIQQQPAYRYVNYICYFTNDQKHSLYRPGFLEKTAGEDSYKIIAEYFNQSAARNLLDQTLYADVSTYLPEDLLVKVDIASMAVSLEARSPFLDHEFMELAASIPVSLKLKGFNKNKYILKEALTNMLPHDILHRPKRGFVVPIEAWFRGNLSHHVADILLGPHATITKQIFREDSIRQLLHAHRQTKINYAPRIWALLTLELWYRDFFT